MMAEISITIAFAIIIIGIPVLVCAALYLKFGWFKCIYHDILGWHKPNGTYHSEGINVHSTCKYCGKDIIQDSQGNWF